MVVMSAIESFPYFPYLMEAWGLHPNYLLSYSYYTACSLVVNKPLKKMLPLLFDLFQHLPFITRLYYSDKSDVVEKLLVDNYRFIQPNLKQQISVSSAVKIHSATGAARSQHTLFVPLLILTSKLTLSVP